MTEHYSYRVKSILQYKFHGVNTLLDIGCGDGKYTIALQESTKAQELHGMDIGAEAVRIATSKGIQMSDIDLNSGRLPFPDSKFDLVFAGEILEHLSTPDDLMREMHRVTKPGGYCVVTTPNIASWYDRLLFLVGYQPYSIPTHSEYRGAGTFLSKARNTTVRKPVHISTSGGCGHPHIQFFTQRSLKALFQIHGYRIEKIWGSPADEFTFPMRSPYKQILIWLDRTVSASRWINSISFVASDITIVSRVAK